jgi:hypothetical protein
MREGAEMGRVQATNASRESVAKGNRESRERIATDKIKADAKNDFSGYYNFKGRLVPAGIVDRNPNRYQGAYKLSNFSYQMQQKDKSLRVSSDVKMAQLDVLKTKLQHEQDSQWLKPLLETANGLVKAKQPEKANVIYSSIISTINQHEGIGLSAADLESMTKGSKGGWSDWIPSWLGGGSAEKLGGQAAGAAAMPSTTTTIPNGGMTSKGTKYTIDEQ